MNIYIIIQPLQLIFVLSNSDLYSKQFSLYSYNIVFCSNSESHAVF